MKKFQKFFAIPAMALYALGSMGCTGSGKPLSEQELWGRLVGTWINEKYAGLYEPQKTVIKQGYLAEDWQFSADANRDAEWKVSFKKGWIDPKGNTYCQGYTRYTEKYPWTRMLLLRVNRSGKILEMLVRQGPEDGVYPTVIDPKASSDEKDWYYIYYRK